MAKLFMLTIVSPRLLPGFALACLGLAQTPPQSIVRMQVIDSFGKPVEYKIERFYNSDDPAQELAVETHGLVISKVQYGLYRTRLRPALKGEKYPVIDAEFLVVDDELLKVFAVDASPQIGLRSGLPPPVKGQVSPIASVNSKSMWVSATPAFAPIQYHSQFETAMIRSNGSFELRDLCAGLYRINVIRDGKIVKSVVMTLPEERESRFIAIRLD